MKAFRWTGTGTSIVPFLRNIAVAILLSTVGLSLAAQPAGKPVNPPGNGLVLKPGEALALTLGDEGVGLYGDAKQEYAMGSLAELAWLRLEGSEWSARRVQYRCKGSEGAFACSNKAGHNHMDLSKALREGCDLAFLAWIRDAQSQWRKDYGEAAAWTRMEEAFAPFLGRRLPVGEALPPLTPAWVGEGTLLRTSPEGLLRWLMDPGQGQVVSLASRMLAGYWVEVKDFLGMESWWFKTATVPVPGDPMATSAWVVAGRGPALVVLHLSRGRGDKEGMARIQEILKETR